MSRRFYDHFQILFLQGIQEPLGYILPRQSTRPFRRSLCQLVFRRLNKWRRFCDRRQDTAVQHRINITCHGVTNLNSRDLVRLAKPGNHDLSIKRSSCYEQLCRS